MLPQHDERTGRAILLKAHLVDGAYYVGRCRNAAVARWSAQHDCFFHWRSKFGQIYIEKIKHPVDEQHFDVFRVVRALTASKFEIPFDANTAFSGRLDDLDEYSHEMWSRPVP